MELRFVCDLVTGRWILLGSRRFLRLQAELLWSSGPDVSDSGIFWLLFVKEVFAEPKYGLMFFPGNHLGPDGSETQAYPLPQVINLKGPEI